MRWTGFPGAPGYSNFFFSTDGGFWDGGIIGDNAQAAAEDAALSVNTAFGRITNLLPAGVTISREAEAPVIDSATGETVGLIDLPGTPAREGAGTGGYSGPSGAVVNWRTTDYRFGRRIRGRTFLVPLDGSAYEDDGTLTDDALSDLRGFGNDIIDVGGGTEFGVWSRPRNGSGGVFATVTGSNVPDLAAVLRSRRD